MTDATWKRHPHSNDYNMGTNWTGSVVPDGTAFFGVSDTTHLSFSAGFATPLDVDSWTFKKGASNYTFHLDFANGRLVFHGAGIVTKDSVVRIINDGDMAFIRAVWCLTRHLRASKVVETGVAHGVTSRFVLEAFRRQGFGQLWSIDLPPQSDSDVHDEIGIAVDDDQAEGWTYIRGSSRRRLRPLLQSTGMIDLFIHDSWHSEYNILFELQTVWPRIRPGGAMVVDDIDLN